MKAERLFFTLLLSGCFFLLLHGSCLAAQEGDASGRTMEQNILRITRKAMSENKSYWAKDVLEIVQSGGTGYQIISLQGQKAYDAGHIPGAVRLDFDLADPAPALARLDAGKKIIVVSPDGQESCKLSLFLRQMGYDAGPMLFGMVGWNWNAAKGALYEGDVAGPLAEIPTAMPEEPQIPLTPSSASDRDCVLGATASAQTMDKRWEVTPRQLAASLDSFFIISMQQPQDYEKAHIRGAVNIPADRFLFGDPTLLRLPRGKKIAVTCYIGHYSNIGTLLLRQLGYQAYTLHWGLAGWNAAGLEHRSPALEDDPGLPVERRD